MHAINKNKQKGVMLISAMIIIAFITTINFYLLSLINANIENTQLRENQKNAFNYLQSVESLTIDILRNDNTNVDTLSEDWAVSIPPLSIAQGYIEAKIKDLQGLLNINNLLNIDIERAQVYLVDDPKFIECFKSLNAQTRNRDQTNALWRNALGKKRQYLHVDELRTIYASDIEAFLNVRPYLTALPQKTPINLNTSPIEIVLCIHPDMTHDIAQNILVERPYENQKELFKALGENLKIKTKEITTHFQKNHLSTTSKYFELSTKITIDTLILNAKSIFYRDNGNISLINRTYTLGN